MIQRYTPDVRDLMKTIEEQVMKTDRFYTCVISEDRAEVENEGPEPVNLLAGDRPMGGL